MAQRIGKRTACGYQTIFFGFEEKSMVDILYVLSEKKVIISQHFVYIFTALLEMFIIIAMGILKKRFKFCSMPI